ncbi:O-antigen ligase family protein [Patescibacteria group bacterium]|nr:O-antigen ligase family protein [Patescibacteria group bacterium]
MDDLVTVRKLVNTYLGLVFKIGLIGVILSTFFLFTNLTTESYDTPKFILLLIFTGILFVLLTFKFTILGKVVFIRTPLDIPLLLLLAVGIVSTVLSSSPYVALLGNQLKIHDSLVSIIVYILFYFVLVNNLRNAKEIKWIFMVIIFASQLLSAITLLAYAGLKVLPPPWVQGPNFTPTGSSFSTAAILTLLLPFIVMQILTSAKPVSKILGSLFLMISGVTIALTGTWATWIAALTGITLTFFAVSGFDTSAWKPRSKAALYGLVGLILPLVVIALITLLSFIPPVGSAKNPIYTASQNFPREIQLPIVPSWKISVSAFRDLPFWGSGPSTYLFNFTNYKPIEFNSSNLWNLRFDSSFNEYLQVLATLGGIGLLALISLTALFASSALPVILGSKATPESDSGQAGARLTKVTLAISGIAFFIILLLHSSTLGLWIIGLLVLASFMVVNLSEIQRSWSSASGNFKNTLFKIAANVTAQDSSETTIKVDALPGIMLVIALAAVLFAGFFGGKFILADYHHRKALNAVAQNQGIVVYNELVAAEKLNPYNDLYRTDLAQTNFALANAIASAKGPTEASPAGSLTDQDKQNIQILLQQSISEGRTAVTLSPKSVINWEILALLYRQISGVAQNALIFSLDSYGRAIFQDPFNPTLRLNVGGVYYAVKNYDMAIRFFTDAINLKPDFANGYYNLSVALKDKGDLSNAQAAAEKALTLVKQSSPDYKTINDYLSDIKQKIASGSQATKEAEVAPPAAQTSGSLQQNELPKVINLPKPDKIATPEAIKKPVASPRSEPVSSANPLPTETPLATLTPSPTPNP